MKAKDTVSNVASVKSKDALSNVAIPNVDGKTNTFGVKSPPRMNESPPRGTFSPTQKEISPPRGTFSPPRKEMSPPKSTLSPPRKEVLPPKGAFSPPKRELSPPTRKEMSLPKGTLSPPQKESSPPKSAFSPPQKEMSPRKSAFSPPQKEMSPPKSAFSPPQKEISPPKTAFSPPEKERSPKSAFSQPQKEMSPPKGTFSPPQKEISPPKEVLPSGKTNVASKVFPPPRNDESPPKSILSPPMRQASLPKEVPLPPRKERSPPKIESPLKKEFPTTIVSAKVNRINSKDDNSVAARANIFETASSSPKEMTPPPVSSFKFKRADSKIEEQSFTPPKPKREDSIGNEIPSMDKLTIVSHGNDSPQVEANDEESNGVGDKIKKFERAAEDASGTLGRLSRHGSVRGQSRERIGSDEFPPPATPFKDNQHFELCPTKVEQPPEKTFNKVNITKWQRSESHDDKLIKPEPQKIIKPEFKAISSPADVTIRSPSLGAKIPDQFPSHGTAFRNVSSPDTTRNKINEDANTQNNFKQCKLKDKKYSVSKGSSYYTRGPDEIWLVKKKDIEEIEERVMDSFRRAGGNVMRSETVRPSSDSGQTVSYAATMGRNKRQYARSESLDPQWAGSRAQTLKRQTSVACTCGHDKKARAKSASPATENVRPRSRSHGDDNGQGHVLDKYETLV